jgi:TetR/AcrR family transcriptional repressor of lmrAB and yxaGH operons
MASVKITDDELIERLLGAFRSVGYDGVSMAELANVTGLQKASLYHRFPEGKIGMAKAVLDYIESESQAWIVTVLGQSSTPPAARLKKALDAIDALYEGGRLNCVLRAFSLGSNASLFREQIARIFNGWLQGFTKLGLDTGKSETEAKQLAQKVIIYVQGVLIVGQTLEVPALFKQTLKDIETEFLG